MKEHAFSYSLLQGSPHPLASKAPLPKLRVFVPFLFTFHLPTPFLLATGG
jgi:hypothetical protein